MMCLGLGDVNVKLEPLSKEILFTQLLDLGHSSTFSHTVSHFLFTVMLPGSFLICTLIKFLI